MPDVPPNIPTSWTPEIPGGRTLAEMDSVIAKGCPAKIEKDTWQYTTWTQNVWNFLAWHIGNGILSNQKYSNGTALRVHYYCYTDTPLQGGRTILLSRTISLTECTLTVTAVSQHQVQVKRTWERWTLTALFKDDVKSATIDGAASAAMSLLGIVAVGIVNATTGIVGAITSLVPIFDSAKAILVARHLADGGIVWQNSGPPSSALESGPTQLPDELCELLRLSFPQPVTIAIPPPGD